MEINDVLKKGANLGAFGIPGILAVNAMNLKENYDRKVSEKALSNQEEGNFQEIINKETIELLKDLAITQRIYNSEDVEIDEHYEKAGKAGIGASLDESSASANINGEKRMMTRRVYKFKGLNKEVENIIEDAYRNFGMNEDKEMNRNSDEVAITESVECDLDEK